LVAKKRMTMVGGPTNQGGVEGEIKPWNARRGKRKIGIGLSLSLGNGGVERKSVGITKKIKSKEGEKSAVPLSQNGGNAGEVRVILYQGGTE